MERQFLGSPVLAGTSVAEMVAAMMGAHAQVLSAAEVSVGVRTEGLTRADVRAALWEDRTLVKTFGPRGTVHLLPAAELPFWTAALPAIPSGAGQFAPEVRLSEEQAELVAAALDEAATPLTLDELGEEVVARTGPWAGDRVMPAFQSLWPRWRQVMHRAGQSGALCFAPDRGRKATYTRPPHFEPLPTADAGLTTLVRHYLRAYGPARARHFARWAAAPGGWADRLFTSLASADEIEEVDFAGEPAWVAAGDTGFPEEPARVLRGVRLLPYFDAYGIAAQPRERLFPGGAYERALARGQAGNYPLLLLDGVVAGVWHQRRNGRRTTVMVEPLGRLTARQERALGERVDRVGEVLEARAELAIGKVTVGPHA
ncbi:winged helix DNA-binding domain-containing protein [Streptomyces tailanensis]|uniref:winged helix DNA-binding domain-containing protein n=1 Tax=Streptomyces tailanensis TaxID=2569858 RepID=UPI00122E6262|nr:winged helix DNA-binding domain-containing protein [Streptomyces tailanensis]